MKIEWNSQRAEKQMKLTIEYSYILLSLAPAHSIPESSAGLPIAPIIFKIVPQVAAEKQKHID